MNGLIQIFAKSNVGFLIGLDIIRWRMRRQKQTMHLKYWYHQNMFPIKGLISSNLTSKFKLYFLPLLSISNNGVKQRSNNQTEPISALFLLDFLVAAGWDNKNPFTWAELHERNCNAEGRIDQKGKHPYIFGSTKSIYLFLSNDNQGQKVFFACPSTISTIRMYSINNFVISN